MLGFRHRRQRAAELDDIPVAVVPVVQQRKIVPDFVDRHGVPRSIPKPYIGSRAAESDIVGQEMATGSGSCVRAPVATCQSGRQIVRRQRVVRRRSSGRAALGIRAAADRAGMIGRALVGDDLIELARAVLGALADHGRGLAADLAGRRLALAELAHVRDRRGRGRHGFGRADLRRLVRFRRLVSRQQHEHQPEPECHAKQKKHLATPVVSFDPVAIDLASLRPD